MVTTLTRVSSTDLHKSYVNGDPVTCVVDFPQDSGVSGESKLLTPLRLLGLGGWS